jgi:peptidoglycan/LPS O-acetylase OafA/YrhL
MNSTKPSELPLSAWHQRRDNNLDALRLLLALGVLGGHGWALVYGNEQLEPLKRWSGNQLSAASLALNGFFFLSGWLVIQSWIRQPSPVAFTAKRLRRIYPGFIFVTLTCLVLYSPLAAAVWPEAFTFRQLHKSAYYALTLSPFKLPGAFAENPFPNAFNLPLWTIPYEVRCYALLAILGLVGALARRRILLLLTGGLLALATLHCLLQPDFPRHPLLSPLLGGWPSSLPRLAGAFILGAAAYACRTKIRLTFIGLGLAVAGLIASLWIPAGLFHLGALSLGYLILWFGYSEHVNLRWLTLGGDYSYGTYLHGWPIQQLLIKFVPGLGVAGLFLLAAPLAWLAGLVSWHLVEKRWLRR